MTTITDADRATYFRNVLDVLPNNLAIDTTDAIIACTYLHQSLFVTSHMLPALTEAAPPNANIIGLVIAEERFSDVDSSLRAQRVRVNRGNDPRGSLTINTTRPIIEIVAVPSSSISLRDTYTTHYKIHTNSPSHTIIVVGDDLVVRRRDDTNRLATVAATAMFGRNSHAATLDSVSYWRVQS